MITWYSNIYDQACVFGFVEDNNIWLSMFNSSVCLKQEILEEFYFVIF